jgi:hypothetical protein
MPARVPQKGSPYNLSGRGFLAHSKAPDVRLRAQYCEGVDMAGPAASNIRVEVNRRREEEGVLTHVSDV